EQFAQASQQAKTETENALLREALAMSAQNSEALIQQLIESQNLFQQELRKDMEIAKNNIYAASNTLKRRVEEVEAMTAKYHQSYQSQWQSQENVITKNHDHFTRLMMNLSEMNQVFSQSLNDVLTDTAGKLIEQVQTDTATALQNNITNINNASKKHIAVIDTAFTKIEKANTTITNYDKRIKTQLDNSIKTYKETMRRFFKMEGFREFFFWIGIIASIVTPIVMIFF
ncbi:MAG: hypothetical protein FWE34_08515, partial [Defluviitaleaceae bacterium]|nr:hypothetical protein [Defluviitaleaceae bacterium]